MYREVSDPFVNVRSFFVWTDPYDVDDKVRIPNDCGAGKLVQVTAA